MKYAQERLFTSCFCVHMEKLLLVRNICVLFFGSINISPLIFIPSLALIFLYVTDSPSIIQELVNQLEHNRFSIVNYIRSCHQKHRDKNISDYLRMSPWSILSLGSKISSSIKLYIYHRKFRRFPSLGCPTVLSYYIMFQFQRECNYRHFSQENQVCYIITSTTFSLCVHFLHLRDPRR